MLHGGAVVTASPHNKKVVHVLPEPVWVPSRHTRSTGESNFMCALLLIDGVCPPSPPLLARIGSSYPATLYIYPVNGPLLHVKVQIMN